MQEECFQELFPWYHAAVDQMVFVGFKIPEELREQARAAAETLQESEGQFIRAAIVEKLEKMGVILERNLVRAPSRRGVGGFPTHKRNREPQPIHKAALVLNESPPTPGGVSSDVGRGAVAGADAVAAMVGRSATPAPSPKAASTTYKKRGQPARTAPRRNSPRSVPAPVPNERGNPT